jgi:hypothetical protein
VATLQKVKWHGREAWQLEDEGMRVAALPEAGGRIVSLFDRAAGAEWLVGPEGSHPLAPVAYGMPFDANHSGGWDEMLPTVVACRYPGGEASKSPSLPDHGELWAVPWVDAGTADGRIALAVVGRALPYRLTRTITLRGPEGLALDYALENLGSARFCYLWAAHPQFACEPGAQVELPDGVGEVVNVFPDDPGTLWGQAGTRHAWPELAYRGEVVRQDRVRPVELRAGRKFWLPPERAIGWAGIRRPSSRTWLRLEWDAAELPYCGVWFDEGCINSVPTVAIEPSQGYYDDLALASGNRRVAWLEPGAVASWALRVRVGQDR